MFVLVILLSYFAILYTYSYFHSSKNSNETFFRGNRNSRWYLVAFGMIGASLSGITFVSVPGMVMWSDMTYLQTCLGYILGYFIVAFVLLPIFYRHNLTTIYSFLKIRLGETSYKTGALFFLISKLIGAAARFYVVCLILDRFVFKELNIPFFVTVPFLMALIWLYTRNGGIRTLVHTDVIQTFFMLLSLGVILYGVLDVLDFSLAEAFKEVVSSGHSRIFEFSDIKSPQNFFKQFISGAFIVVVMTGLDQDMMQKNLTCKTLHEAKKDMCTYAFAFAPVNLLFMVLGILLICAFNTNGIAIPEKFDNLLIDAISNGILGMSAKIFFIIGIVSAAFSSADSSLTALTTTYCVDIKEKSSDVRLRKNTHAMMAILFAFAVLIFNYFNSTSLIDAIFILCGYTYGPLLGLFSFAILGRRNVMDKATPYIAMLSPVACFVISQLTLKMFGYKFGYELLLLNGALTFAGLYAFSSEKKCVSLEN
ncbi:sodium:solute symporter [Succinivibrio dextrinosolvens]|jgi:Na+/proline symporter|uniref:sodium:solute symporter n=1 Tax=Succinivibrio dextrinosolvens TaxID=83771 RepID=UPI00241E07AB|nr:sodium:solute symporter [Succinivibrio dextrinosolvens]MBE6424302.1 sodium:solute symporter [Succinivibrio dextrinosolvens]